VTGAHAGHFVRDVQKACKDEASRNGHLAGEIAKALFAKAEELFATPPQVEKLEILASKAAAA
jgi:hypothetical protein